VECHPTASCHIAGAVTWRIKCHVIPGPRATLQGERIPSTILKIVFRRILFFVFLMQFGLRRAVAFILSSIHLLCTLFGDRQTEDGQTDGQTAKQMDSSNA